MVMLRLFVFLFLFFLSNIAFSQSTINPKTYIPPQAFQYKPVIKKELDDNFPTIPTYNYIPALIEHESCISLTHRRCWSPTSELLTSREQGTGLFQVTRTFREDGSVRFDTLSDLKNKYKRELQEASWENIKLRPDLQIRMGILLVRDNYKALYNIEDPYVRLHFTDAAYNTGLGNVNKKRRACGLNSNCNPQLWFNNVENECIGLTKPIYGNRSACDIVRHHTQDVFNNRLPKYKSRYFLEDKPNAK
jgi:hypothetical protein